MENGRTPPAVVLSVTDSREAEAVHSTILYLVDTVTERETRSSRLERHQGQVFYDDEKMWRS